MLVDEISHYPPIGIGELSLWPSIIAHSFVLYISALHSRAFLTSLPMGLNKLSCLGYFSRFIQLSHGANTLCLNE